MAKKSPPDYGIYCPSCESSHILTLFRGRYVIMMSFLPVVVMLAAAYMWYTAIILFIPAVILTNYYIAKKNTPMIICQKCRAVTKGKDAEEAAGAV